MIGITGKALRVKSGILVYLSGLLPNTCSHAKISDIYPGGNIYYVVDPGYAEVFVDEWVEKDQFCLQVLVPWTASVFIPSDSHDKVKVYVNGTKELCLKVDKKLTKKAQKNLAALGEKADAIDILPWKVIALVGINPEGDPAFQYCVIIPDHEPFPKIYRKVHGPATYQECEEFVLNNCAEC